VYKVELPAGWDGAFVLYAGALVKIKVWDMAGAEKDLRSALAAVPDFPSALLALATVELVRGEPPGAAEKLLRRALELEPDYPEASRALAELLDHLGRRNEAASVRARASAARSLTPFSAPSR
jgi:predicted Zn-dependent protease